MHKKSRSFTSRLCVVYARGRIECETVETELKCRKRKSTGRFGFSSEEIDFSEVLRGKRPRFVLLFCLVLGAI